MTLFRLAGKSDNEDYVAMLPATPYVAAGSTQSRTHRSRDGERRPPRKEVMTIREPIASGPAAFSIASKPGRSSGTRSEDFTS